MGTEVGAGSWAAALVDIGVSVRPGRVGRRGGRGLEVMRTTGESAGDKLVVRLGSFVLAGDADRGFPIGVPVVYCVQSWIASGGR
jgi:hypothetical protein